MKPKIDWIIHAIGNGITCEKCNDADFGFFPNACNFHTHGMAKYNHMDFQMVLQYSPQEIARILNTLGLRVQRGERFKNGDQVEGIFADCNIRLMEFEETGRTVLRVIVPDRLNRFPEEKGCEYPYTLQIFATDFLYKGSSEGEPQ